MSSYTHDECVHGPHLGQTLLYFTVDPPYKLKVNNYKRGVGFFSVTFPLGAQPAAKALTQREVRQERFSYLHYLSCSGTRL